MTVSQARHVLENLIVQLDVKGYQALPCKPCDRTTVFGVNDIVEAIRALLRDHARLIMEDHL